MYKTLNKCYTLGCANLKHHLKHFHSTLDECTHKVNSDYNVLIKIQLPPDGQKALKKEWLDVEVELRNFKNSGYGQRIGDNLDEWDRSDEKGKLDRILQKYHDSAEGQKLAQEVKEAAQYIEASTHEIEDGIEINNYSLDGIDKQLGDVVNEVRALDYNGWGEKIHGPMDDALNEEHMKQAKNDFEDWKKTKNAKNIQKEIQDVDRTLREHLKVTDIP